MRKSVIMPVIATVFLTSSSVFAQNKIVVIPMASSSSESGGIGGVKIYDNNNTFVGYTNFDINSDMLSIINNNRVCTLIDKNGMLSLLYEVNFYSIDDIYLTSDCTGNNYSLLTDENLYTIFCNGIVEKIYYISANYSKYIYVDFSDSYTITSGSLYSRIDYNGLCNQHTADTSLTVYKTIVNNPAISGFNNSYTPPLRAEYSLPK